MGTITSNSLAAATGSSVKNTVFESSSQVLPRKGLLIGTGDPAKEAGIDIDTPILVTSPEDVGDKTGFGFMLHRLAEQFYKGSRGQIETWMIMQTEDGSAQAAGEIDFVGSTGVLAGTLSLYISGILERPIGITITAAMTADAIATAVAAAITAIKELPVTATALTTVVTITSKSVGEWGNDISIEFNLLASDKTPTGVTWAVTPMAAGAATDDISTALDSLGTGDNANEANFTDMDHGYGQNTAQLNHVSTYVGEGNEDTGLWAKLVHKPFRSLVGDVAAGSSGLSDLITLSDGRLEDRASGVIAVPGSATHPQEIAAQAMGIMARIANNRPESNYIDQLLSGVDPGSSAAASRWTSDYTNRDTAVKSGISPTFVTSSGVALQNVITFYRPASVPVTSNGYREMYNIAKLQNMLNSQFQAFNAEGWNGITIVSDLTELIPSARAKARDVDSVIDEIVAIILDWQAQAWIFESAFSIAQLQANPPTIRPGGDGFDITISVVLSGSANIVDSQILFDTSIAVLTA